GPCYTGCNPPGCYCSAYHGYRKNYIGNCIPINRCPIGNYPSASKDFIQPTFFVTDQNITEDSTKFGNVTF
ncbi:unnamed protein product, partial [Onchocerca flexuosa]|uniref:CC domain-containing protein n=1 Tax=Onchocerca flexuosa TaxID=387005 RepID=A0A183I804_9BILA